MRGKAIFCWLVIIACGLYVTCAWLPHAIVSTAPAYQVRTGETHLTAVVLGPDGVPVVYLSEREMQTLLLQYLQEQKAGSRRHN